MHVPDCPKRCALRAGLLLLVLASLARVPAALAAADPATLAGWIALDAPTGHETLATGPLAATLHDWHADPAGNLVRTNGSGRPHQVVACALDAFAYAVTEITDDGYLRLHRIGRGSADKLWDQAHAGQQVRVLGADGPRIGVTAVANNHFSFQHRDDTAVLTADDLWVDVGVERRAEVAKLGIHLLDPVLRDLPPWSFADEAAGPSAGARVGCAAVVAAAEAGLHGAGSTSYVLSTQQAYGWVGLGGALRALAPVDQVILAGRGEAAFRDAAADGLGSGFAPVLAQTGAPSVRALAPRVTDAGALMERVQTSAADQLLAALVHEIDPDAALPAWLPAPARTAIVAPVPGRGRAEQAQTEAAALLDPLAERSAVSGHEGPVRAQVLAGLPEWARRRVQTDELGNLWIEFGGAGDDPGSTAAQDAPVTVFMAHTDEVGFEVESIADDGTVTLAQRGGVVTPAWEGQPALLQLDAHQGAASVADPAQLRGVFLHRSDPGTRAPDGMRAWFGMDGAALAAAGVTPGMGVTGYKEGHRAGPHRYVSRALDDRVGDTALLLALRGLDPAKIDHPLVFAWTVREEIGLFGAAELAKRYGMRTRRVYSVDTFVSSDTPLESPHFAHAPLGAGPVLRSVENSSMATPAELARNRAIARAAGIDVQVGLTQGGTDGTMFTYFGAPNAGISWPGRYSHSPAEIADLRDVTALVKLVRALALAPPEG